MNQDAVDVRLARFTDQGCLNVYTQDVNNNKVNLDTLTVEPITPVNETKGWMVRHRNVRLADSDWTQGADSPLSDAKKAEWATYRQALRDITNGLTTVEQVNAVVWPEKPEA